MTRTTLVIEGMMCGMCEAHINDAIRRNFDVKRVKSSRHKKQCLIVSEQELDPERVAEVIAATGYTLVSMDEA